MTLLSGIFLSFAVINYVQNPTLETYDDAINLPYYMDSSDSNQVLGASSETEAVPVSAKEVCPESKPVLGWIDHEGKKLILESIPEGEAPSACFETVEGAQKEGYYYNDELYKK